MITITFEFNGILTKRYPSSLQTMWTIAGFTHDKISVPQSFNELLKSGIINRSTYLKSTTHLLAINGITKQSLGKICKLIKPIENLKEVLQTLKNCGYSLNIVSNEFDFIINNVLGENVKYFDNIKSNHLNFNKNNEIISITDNYKSLLDKASDIQSIALANNSRKKDSFFFSNFAQDNIIKLYSSSQIIGVNINDNDKYVKFWDELLEIKNLLDIQKMLNPTNANKNINTKFQPKNIL